MKKIRVIVNGVSFYASANLITKGIGDNSKLNRAVLQEYGRLVKENVNKGTIGVGTSDRDGYQIQIDYV